MTISLPDRELFRWWKAVFWSNYKIVTNANPGRCEDNPAKIPKRGFETDMFKSFFKNRAKTPIEQKLALQREMHQQEKLEARRELAMRANIVSKLKRYKAEEDTTISNFKLTEDEVERRLSNRPASAQCQDIWGKANPKEIGHWKKENRNQRNKK